MLRVAFLIGCHGRRLLGYGLLGLDLILKGQCDKVDVLRLYFLVYDGYHFFLDKLHGLSQTLKFQMSVLNAVDQVRLLMFRAVLNNTLA